MHSELFSLSRRIVLYIQSAAQVKHKKSRHERMSLLFRCHCFRQSSARCLHLRVYSPSSFRTFVTKTRARFILWVSSLAFKAEAVQRGLNSASGKEPDAALNKESWHIKFPLHFSIMSITGGREMVGWNARPYIIGQEWNSIFRISAQLMCFFPRENTQTGTKVLRLTSSHGSR